MSGCSPTWMWKGKRSFLLTHLYQRVAKGAIAQSKAEFDELTTRVAEFYRSLGQRSAKLISMKEKPISNDYSMVKVLWGVAFEKTGDMLIEFGVTCFAEDGS